MDYTTFDDETLVRLIARQDRGAFEALYARHAGLVLGLSYRILGERRQSEDVAQEAFWRVWKGAEGFDTARGNARTWLVSIAHHLAIDLTRRSQRRPVVEMDADEDDDSWNVPDESADVVEAIEARMSAAEVRAALGQLPEAQRQVIELAYYKGLTHGQIAENLGVPTGTIHTRARLAMQKLRDALSAPIAGQER
ncbi:MAG: sigma-70 family RNA polymerase sigma factor [Thermoflexales bacterium]